MKTTDFAKYLTDYLSIYLPGQRNLSPNTITSYRDTFKLLLLFCREEKGISPECLTLAHIDEDLVLAFMAWIETERKCSITTRNQRLAAIHAFFRYVQAQTPERLLMYQRILSIPPKKTGKPPDKVSPHVFRHTKTMHLLQANVNLVYIRDFLGHASVTTSEIYARADARMKRLALEQAYSPTVIDDVPAWQDDQDLLSWLQKICQ